MNGDVSDLDISDDDENQENDEELGFLKSESIINDDSSSENGDPPSAETEVFEKEIPENEPPEKISSSRRQFWKKTEK